MPAARAGHTPALAAVGEQPIRGLPGVGPALAEKFAARGLLALQDLWLHLPLRYEDRTRLTPIARLPIGQPAQVEGRVEAVERGFRYRPVLKVAIGDDSRSSLVLRFFHFRGSQAQQFRIGRRVRCYGEVRPGQFGLEMVHPSYRFLAEDEAGELRDRLDPVYPTVEGVGPQTLARHIGQALQRLPGDEELELLPAALRRELQLPSLRQALLAVHHPPVDIDPAVFAAFAHPAQQRLAFEEMLAHQLSLRRQRLSLRAQGASPIPPSRSLVRKFEGQLPFALTSAQQRVRREIEADLAQAEPMLRLVQGDVGSGKTVVAAMAALAAIERGRQVALMAPTELLAEQHLKNFRRWFEPLGIGVAWLAGKVGGRARAQVLADIAAGTAKIAIGTHALMQEGVAFADLALAIVDEQHRFGVHQRLALRDKGRAASPAPRGRGKEAERQGTTDGSLPDASPSTDKVPHQLVMTATPIPRTLAMSAYADLDVSVIDELPPGRTPVTTVAISAERRGDVIERIRAACAEGRQAYWVCTLIDESDEVAAQSAQSTYEALVAALPGQRLALLHGRMRPADKQAVMARFQAGEIQLLVATTVIEVGVDVPNASLMVIENAERLGLAQLHQLRGRVGRGDQASSCVLLYKPPLGAIARERLEVMRGSNDGFVIAEKDLELRGPGELLGTRQTGLAGFRIADLARDARLLPQVQRAAERLLAEADGNAGRIVQRWVGSAERFAGA
jgi:ATP-dependent DNA helicase RecG